MNLTLCGKSIKLDNKYEEVANVILDAKWLRNSHWEIFNDVDQEVSWHPDVP